MLVDHQKEEVQKYLASDPVIAKHLEKITLFEIAYFDVWMRDMGAIFVVQYGQLKVVDFGFNSWTYLPVSAPEAILDGLVCKRIAHALQLPVIRSFLISEGGDRE